MALSGYARLGQIMVDSVGMEACLAGYLTEDLYWIGRYAVGYGDIDANGELN